MAVNRRSVRSLSPVRCRHDGDRQRATARCRRPATRRRPRARSSDGPLCRAWATARCRSTPRPVATPATPISVTTLTDLNTALAGTEPAVVQIVGTTIVGNVRVGSNKTLVGDLRRRGSGQHQDLGLVQRHRPQPQDRRQQLQGSRRGQRQGLLGRRRRGDHQQLAPRLVRSRRHLRRLRRQPGHQPGRGLHHAVLDQVLLLRDRASTRRAPPAGTSSRT